MNDFASDTFLNKWPNWVRWVCFLPAAIIVPLIMIFFQNMTTKWYLGIEGKSLMLDLMSDIWLGAGFVGVGAMVHRKNNS